MERVWVGGEIARLLFESTRVKNVWSQLANSMGKKERAGNSQGGTYASC
jgi:hypothetical protein